MTVHLISDEAPADTVELSDLLRRALKAAPAGMTLAEMRCHMLTAGVMVEACELSSCMAKALARSEVRRLKECSPAGQAGRREVWRYWWVAAKSEPMARAAYISTAREEAQPS